MINRPCKKNQEPKHTVASLLPDQVTRCIKHGWKGKGWFWIVIMILGGGGGGAWKKLNMLDIRSTSKRACIRVIVSHLEEWMLWISVLPYYDSTEIKEIKETLLSENQSYMCLDNTAKPDRVGMNLHCCSLVDVKAIETALQPWVAWKHFLKGNLSKCETLL